MAGSFQPVPAAEFPEGSIQFSYQKQQNQGLSFKILFFKLIRLANKYTQKWRAYHSG